jgi:hypothetical protein
MTSPKEKRRPATGAALLKPNMTPDYLGEIVKMLRQRARFYFARYEAKHDPRDAHRAAAFQAALVGILEARRP